MREKRAFSCVTETPETTSARRSVKTSRARPNCQLQAAFPGRGLWGLCPPLAGSAQGQRCCCQLRLCVMCQACTGSKLIVSATVFSYRISSAEPEREFVALPLLQNGVAFDTVL